MDDVHRKVITDNLGSLVDLTGEKVFEDLLYHLLQKNVFNEEMVSRIKTSSKDFRTRVREFYLIIQRRGPEAFPKLLEVLYETGHWHIRNVILPDGKLNVQEQQFHSLRKSPPVENPSIRREIPKPVQPTDRNQNPEKTDDDFFEPIVVKKSTVYNNPVHPDIQCYRMKSKNRGVLFMVNIIEFENDVEDRRDGAQVDQENLEALFTQIGFHEIIIHKNLAADKFRQELKSLSTSPILKHTDCLFVIVGSHGNTRKGDTSVTCSDGKMILVEEILNQFNSENCPLLHNIPKVFIFQLCRGNSPDFGTRGSSSQNISNGDKEEYGPRTKFDGKSTNIIMRTYTDMVVVHSTVPGFQSHRDTKYGSWYFISMCRVFMKHCHNTHLSDLFTLVDIDLKDIPLKRLTMQTSDIKYWGFNRHCYLNPGLFED